MIDTKLLENRKFLITGACGSVGTKLIEILVALQLSNIEIIAIDNNEEKIFECRRLNHTGVSYLCIDINNTAALQSIICQVDIVIHLAAMKHVEIGDNSPEQLIKTNLNSLNNILQLSAQSNIERFVFASSDKAVFPTNAMGASKLIGEKLVTAMNARVGSDMKFCSTRFGNVIGSSGSVLPIFKKQLQLGKDLTLTSLSMTRFIMTLDDAASFILNAALTSIGGEIFVSKMHAIRIEDLAKALCKRWKELNGKCNSKIVVIGKKQGEKEWEELMTLEELARGYDHGDFMSIIDESARRTNQPQKSKKLSSKTALHSHYSKHMQIEEIMEYLVNKKLIA